jgi:NAD(P)-dependent dehydrogenase (short-subunit alcohol dehydrogenase family)
MSRPPSDFGTLKFDNVLAVNLKGAMFQAQAAARHMNRSRVGR